MGKGVQAAMMAKGLFTSGTKPVIAYLNGGPTDNNSKLFKQGYAGVLDPLIKTGKASKGPDQGRAGWDNQKARTIFEQMLVKTRTRSTPSRRRTTVSRTPSSRRSRPRS